MYDSEIDPVSARAGRRLTEATEYEEASDIAVELGTVGMFQEMNDEAPQYFSTCGPDIILTRQERWRQAQVIDSGDHFTVRTKERQIGPESDFQFQFQKTDETTIHFEPKPTPNPPINFANESADKDINGVCIQHLTTSSTAEESSGER